MEEKIKVKEFLENSKSAMVALITRLTAIKSMAPENGGTGEMQRAKCLEEFLRNNGITDLTYYNAPDKRVTGGVRPNLVATIQGSTRRVLWIISHIDTVPEGDISKWATPPFLATLKGNKLFGRGCEDNTQGLASAIFAVLALKECKITPVYTVKLLFTSDEEVGSNYGVKWMLQNTDAFVSGDDILIPDGGDKLGETIEIAEKSILWLKFIVAGRQTHGSRPDAGVNSCLAASVLTVKLHKKLHEVFVATDNMFTPNISTFEPTMREKNVDTVNIIPGLDIFYFDCRVLPCYKLSDILSEIETICEEFEESYKVNITMEVLQMVESPTTNKSSSIVQKLFDSLKITRDITAKVIGIGGGTVAGELRTKGFDCAVWSTLDETAHTYNEYCIVDNIVLDAITMAHLMCS